MRATTSTPMRSDVNGMWTELMKTGSHMLPQNEWAPGMAEALEGLRGEIVADGWMVVGHGEQAMQDQYKRQGWMRTARTALWSPSRAAPCPMCGSYALGSCPGGQRPR